MGISLALIQKMQGLGLFGKGRTAILDIGSSNLYLAPAEGVIDFLAAHGIPVSEEVQNAAARLEKGSAYDSVHGGINGAFVGELFEMAGMHYASIDIASGYKTLIFDLNCEGTPTSFVNAFDLVLNYGTTEHLLNQYNAFKVIHESTKVGGYIVHQLPYVGFSNHGYFTYTPRCMFDLARYNRYELVGFWLDGPGAQNDLLAGIRDYQRYFPALSATLADRHATGIGKLIADLALPDIGFTVVFRKVRNAPYAAALERSTSVGSVPDSVTSRYEQRTLLSTVLSPLLSIFDRQPELRQRISRLLPNGLKVFLRRQRRFAKH